MWFVIFIHKIYQVFKYVPVGIVAHSFLLLSIINLWTSKNLLLDGTII